jgi:hypothetical protein
MGRTRQTAAGVIATLQGHEAELGRSPALTDLVRKLEIADYRWRKEYGGTRVDRTAHLSLERTDTRPVGVGGMPGAA